MHVSNGTDARFGRHGHAFRTIRADGVGQEICRGGLQRRRDVIIFVEVIRKIVAMVTGCTELVGRVVGASVGCDGLGRLGCVVIRGV